MSRCPAGHESATADYCDVCGSPMDAAPAAPAAPEPAASSLDLPDPAPAQSAPSLQTCPHCQAVNPEINLFCEVCGFDFTTGVMPRVEGPSFLTPVEIPDAAQAAPTDPSSEASPTPDDSTPDTLNQSGSPSEPSLQQVETAPDPAADGPAPAAEDEDPVADPVRTAPKPLNRPPSREVAGDWVVEVWIDPDWYAAQDTDDPCPSAAPPEIVRITGSDALVGRRSRSSAPDVDCGIDSAVSRRQALLASDGRRWWIEDLDSSNGTWVAPAIGPLPEAPITARTEVDADDRIYVGAWTRLVVRPAVESELTE